MYLYLHVKGRLIYCSFSILLELSLVLFHFDSEFMYIILLVIFIPSMHISGAVALSPL